MRFIDHDDLKNLRAPYSLLTCAAHREDISVRMIKYDVLQHFSVGTDALRNRGHTPAWLSC